MTINIKLFTDEAYKTLQKNYKNTFDQIQLHPSDDSWLEDFLGFPPYETRKYEIEDFELKYDENYDNVMQENAIILHEHLKDLPRYILYDVKFWAWITFSKCYKQALCFTKLTDIQFRNMWVPAVTSRSLTRGVMSRFFFIVDMCYDENSNNHYTLVPFLFANQDIFRDISDRSIRMMDNPKLAIIQLEKELIENEHVEVNRSLSREITKYCLRLGSVRLLDVMTKDDIYSLLYAKCKSLIAAQNSSTN